MPKDSKMKEKSGFFEEEENEIGILTKIFFGCNVLLTFREAEKTVKQKKRFVLKAAAPKSWRYYRGAMGNNSQQKKALFLCRRSLSLGSLWQFWFFYPLY